MPSPKSGSAGSLVAPKAPEAALEADVADPGEVEEVKAEQRQTQTGKYGSALVAGADGGSEEELEDAPTSWISFDLKDDKGNAVPNEPYEVTLADGSIRTGSLDGEGRARLNGIPPGQCQIKFPQKDKNELRRG